MAKETTIIFVYDTELLKREEDDPNSAILYFYPTWVSDQQKTALCGQLMGTIRCLKSIFSMPKLVSLQTGKFCIIENNQFILAVGSDRNIPDWVLDHRSHLFYSLVNFFHKDFVNLALLYKNEALSAKLYHIFDTYLKLMLFGGNIFSQVPMLDMPKSGSTVFMEAVAFLDRCRDFPYALGGTILYHNKVVATHLSASTTKKLVFADPYRIKNPAEILETNFELPSGVQLLQVYITNKDFCSLHESALRSRCILQHLFNKKNKRNESPDETQENPEPSTSLLKRDTSLLFTSVTEEDDAASNKKASNCLAQNSVTYRRNSQRRSRPNSLNLKSHNFDLNETKLNSKVTPITSYCGQTSIASTPMTESKIFLHQEILSCLDKKDLSIEDFDEFTSDQKNDLDHPSEENCPEKLSCVDPHRNLSLEISRNQSTTSGLTQNADNEDSINESQVLLSSKEPKGIGRFPSDLTKVFLHGQQPFRKSSSLVDLSEILISISKIPIQYSRLKNGLIISPKSSVKLKRSKTIHDPVYPVFKHEGLVASQYYFEERLRHDFVTTERNLERKNGRIYPKGYFNINTDTKIKKDEVTSDTKQIKIQESKKHRKSLTLPLKPLNPSETHRIERKYSMGVQLTPLMNKLTVLALEDEAKPGKTPVLLNPHGVTPNKDTLDVTFKSKESRKCGLQEDSTLQKCALLVCGQQNVVLGLLLQEDCSKDRESIEKLWELCTEQLPKLEKQINYCLQSAQTVAVPQDVEPYSFLSLDSEWDTVKRGGPWDNDDLNNLSRLHGDFKEHEDITDIFFRNPESVIYGHQFESSQVFYHENASVTNGLVQPSDAIGFVQQKARRSLDRDHNIVLP